MQYREVDYVELAGWFGNPEFILLKGYSSANRAVEPGTRYKQAKVPASYQKKEVIKVSLQEIPGLLLQEHWVGIRVPVGFVVIDIDDMAMAKKFEEAMRDNQVAVLMYRTNNGMHFIFQDSKHRVTRQVSKHLTVGGFVVDTRVAPNGYSVLPTGNIVDRSIIMPDCPASSLREVPAILLPLRMAKPEDEIPASDYPVDEGGRNSALISCAGRLVNYKGHYGKKISFEVDEALEEINDWFMFPPVEQEELTNITRSAGSFPEPDAIATLTENEAIELGNALGVDYPVAVPHPFTFEQGNIIYHWQDYRTGNMLRKEVGPVFIVASCITGEQSFMVLKSINREVMIPLGTHDKKQLMDLLSPFIGRYLDKSRLELLDRYIGDYFAGNNPVIPRLRGIQRVGWYDGILMLPSRQQDVVWLNENAVEAYCQQGDAERQKELFRYFMRTPASVVVLAALASCLLRPLKVQNFAVHIAGLSNTGKSCVGHFIMSLYGQRWSLYHTWNATGVAKELLAVSSNDMPLFIDEIHSAGDKLKGVIDYFYNFEAGKGKGRGDKNLHLRRNPQFKSVLISTGELDLDSIVAGMSNDARTKPIGMYRRCIEVQSDGLLASAVGIEKDAVQLYAVMDEAYGFIGVEWIEFVEKTLDELKAQYLDEAAENTGGMNNIFRLLKTVLHSRYMASLLSQQEIASAEKRIEAIAREQHSKVSATRNIVEDFYEALRDYIIQNSGKFHGMRVESDRYIAGTEGSVEHTEGLQISDVYLLPSVFNRIVRHNKFNATDLKKSLVKADLLEKDPGGKYSVVHRIDIKTVRCYHLREVFYEQLGENAERVARELAAVS